MLSTAIALVTLLTPALQDEEILWPGTGEHKRSVATRSAEAQAFFDQGLNWLYAFNHREAQRSFEAATRIDPLCAMAWWGVAVSQGPHINYPIVDDDGAKLATEALAKARSLSSGIAAADRTLIEAASKRYRYPQPQDRSGLDRAYANAMRDAWRRHPKDGDVGSLFAESMMNLRPWDLWTPQGKPQPGTPEIVATLEGVLRAHPNHPFANHLYIHAVEASPNPERALAAADRLIGLQPGLGHNVHMPSHIYVRVGQWQKAIDSNAAAMKVDAEYRARRPRTGLYRVYMAHNNHMLAFAAMMAGQRARAVEAIDAMVAAIPEDFKKDWAPVVDGFLAMPIEVRQRFGMWDEVLAVPEFAETYPLARSLRRAARAVAFAARGETSSARTEQSQFYVERVNAGPEIVFGNNGAPEILLVAEHLMNGEILIAEGKPEAAIATLEKAARCEDRLRYSEPPDWIQPTRHTLGAYLVSLGRYAEAERVYRDDLLVHPNNGWSLYGMSRSLAGLGRGAESELFAQRFEREWRQADTKITSSCLCIPGR